MVRAAKRDGLSVKAPEGFEAIPGCGVKASFGEHLVEVGADRLMTRYGIDITRFADEAARLADEGKSPLYAVVDGRLAAVLAVADPIKATTAEALKALHALGVMVAVVTGDHRRPAEAIAPIGNASCRESGCE